jgi:hypothetical protein
MKNGVETRAKELLLVIVPVYVFEFSHKDYPN